ncbi:hypothetical protein T10_7824 [Trichinella papuae]|uniref:Uncharacterized protein n=1 Tax=Trichinella papuae TaxID=268474 RepID=A0A0V1M867_9BILA|nr:hypothetical protein T10_7824 [Trichinella papuae]
MLCRRSTFEKQSNADKQAVSLIRLVSCSWNKTPPAFGKHLFCASSCKLSFSSPLQGEIVGFHFWYTITLNDDCIITSRLNGKNERNSNIIMHFSIEFENFSISTVVVWLLRNWSTLFNLLDKKRGDDKNMRK